MSESRKNALVAVVSLLVALILCEAAFRIVKGVSPFDSSNFRNTNVTRINLSDASRYDERLGWALKDDLRYPTFTTTKLGLRRSAAKQSDLRPGHVLVVGSSFAAGAEVSDAETFPALLEGKLGRPVENGAAGGYGFDQIVLRAEQLIPAIKPEILVIEIMDGSLKWLSYSHLTRPKPYFTLEKSDLVAHHQPVPYEVSRDDPYDRVKSIAGYSLIVDRVMAALDPDTWYGAGEKMSFRIQNDPVDIACALLQRLKVKLDQSKTRPLMITNTGSSDVLDADAPPRQVTMVEECANALGYQIVSAFGPIRKIFVNDPKGFDKLWVITKGIRGHMSKDGNALVAELIEQALKQAPPAAQQKAHATRFVPGDGQNMIASSETLEAVFLRQPSAVLRRSPGNREGLREFRATAEGVKGEHYLQSKSFRFAGGPLTLSMDAKSEKFDLLKVQLLDAASDGLIADFDLKRRTSSSMRTRTSSAQQLRGGTEPLTGGWSRIWFGAILPAGEMRIVVQFSNAEGNFGFEPSGEGLFLRALQLEKGQSATAYRPTSGQQRNAARSGDGVNRLSGVAAKSLGASHVTISELSESGPARGAPVLRLAASTDQSEHYASTGWKGERAGPYTLSVYVREQKDAAVRLQLLDASSNGAVLDYRLTDGAAGMQRIGASDGLDFSVEKVSSGWLRLSLTANLPGNQGSVIVQLATASGGTSFAGSGRALTIQAPMVEYGETASAFCAPGSCKSTASKK